MSQLIQSESETKTRSEKPAPLSRGINDLPILCNPGCACGTPVKTDKWKIVIVLIVIVAAAIALIYKEMM